MNRHWSCRIIVILGFLIVTSVFTHLKANETNSIEIPEHCGILSAEEDLSIDDLRECFKIYKQAYEAKQSVEAEENSEKSYEPQMKPAAYEPQMKPAAYEPQMRPTAYEPQMKPAAYEPQMRPAAYDPQRRILKNPINPR